MDDDEWDEKRVADLEVGDDVRDYGVILLSRGTQRNACEFQFSDGWVIFRPADARVDVRRPVEVTVRPIGCASVYIGERYIGSYMLEVANEYAERLRGSADERAKALGQ